MISSSSFFLLSFLPIVLPQRLLPAHLRVGHYTRPGSCTLLAHSALDSLRSLASYVVGTVDISGSSMPILSVP